MKAVVFSPKFNMPALRADGTPRRDADEFQAEARRFMAQHGIEGKPYLFDTRADSAPRRAEVLKVLEGLSGIEVFAFFCHGWKDGIQCGFTTAKVAEFVAALARSAVPGGDIKLLLYCCSTAADGDKRTDDEKLPGPGGDGGFADAVRDEAARVGLKLTVWGHSVAGHTTKNPWVRVFVPGETAGGHWVIDTSSKLWARWVRALEFVVKGPDGKSRVDPENTFRFRFPFMTPAAIEAEISAPRARA